MNPVTGINPPPPSTTYLFGDTPTLNLNNSLVCLFKTEKMVVVLHLPIGSLKTCSGLQPVPSYEPSTYQPIGRWRSHCAIEYVFSLRIIAKERK